MHSHERNAHTQQQLLNDATEIQKNMHFTYSNVSKAVNLSSNDIFVTLFYVVKEMFIILKY